MGTTRSGKAKGRKGQQEIRDMLLEVFDNLEPGDIRSTAMGQGGVDIQLSPKALEYLPISTEVKRRKSFATVYNWMQQADRKDGNYPVVFFRADRKDWLVFMETDYYMDLLKHAKLYKEMVQEKGTTEDKKPNDESLECGSGSSGTTGSNSKG